jgi:hypothetical protein
MTASTVEYATNDQVNGMQVSNRKKPSTCAFGGWNYPPYYKPPLPTTPNALQLSPATDAHGAVDARMAIEPIMVKHAQAPRQNRCNVLIARRLTYNDATSVEKLSLRLLNRATPTRPIRRHADICRLPAETGAFIWRSYLGALVKDRRLAPLTGVPEVPGSSIHSSAP